jgi:hypothetical protein
MGPLLVVVVDEGIEASLLLQRVPGRRPGGFLLEGEMHALVGPVLLRVAVAVGDGVHGADGGGLDAEVHAPQLGCSRFSCAMQGST